MADVQEGVVARVHLSIVSGMMVYSVLTYDSILLGTMLLRSSRRQ